MNRKQPQARFRPDLPRIPLLPLSSPPRAFARSAFGDLNRRRMSRAQTWRSIARARAKRLASGFLAPVARQRQLSARNMPLSSLPPSLPPSLPLPLPHPSRHPSLSNLPRRRGDASLSRKDVAAAIGILFVIVSRWRTRGCAGRSRRKKARRLMAI
jgi:hypothetical protein